MGTVTQEVGLRTKLAEEGVQSAGEVHPDESGQTAEAAVGAAMDATMVVTRCKRDSIIASELCPVACEKLIRRRFLRGRREQISSCCLLHQSVLYRRSVTSCPVENLNLCLGIALSLHGTAGSAIRCRQQVLQTRVRKVRAFLIEPHQLCWRFPW